MQGPGFAEANSAFRGSPSPKHFCSLQALQTWTSAIQQTGGLRYELEGRSKIEMRPAAEVTRRLFRSTNFEPFGSQGFVTVRSGSRTGAPPACRPWGRL